MKKSLNRMRPWGAVCTLLLLVSCYGVEPEHVFSPSYFNLPKTAYFPTATNIPDNNRLSVQGVKLGRYLFYDTRLSGNWLTDTARGENPYADLSVSCASCHRQEKAFDGGYEGMSTPRAVLPLVNVAYNTRCFGWKGSLTYPDKNIENLIQNTLLDTLEMANVRDSLVKRVSRIKLYPPLFEEAFGSREVTFERISFALAQFVRTLVSSDSRFDRYLRGELLPDEQLTAEELRGYVLFTTEEGADCFHCHGGSGNVLFSTYEVLNNGLEADGGMFRVPTLRNIALAAPYMHDGRFATLDEVIDFYSENVHTGPSVSPLMHHAPDGGVQLTPYEKQCLKAFLLTLTDEKFISNPAFSNPF